MQLPPLPGGPNLSLGGLALEKQAQVQGYLTPKSGSF